MKTSDCDSVCSPMSSMDVLNRECFCVGVDQRALHASLDAVLAAHGLTAAFADSHPHLFAALPVFVSPRHIDQIAGVVAAIEAVTALPGYRSTVLSWAPEIARFDPGSPGGLLGLDFHLEPAGPRLIEINTNPGGALLNALLGQAQQPCLRELTLPATDAGEVEASVIDSLLSEWRLQRGVAPLRFVAIVDEAPEQQYLYAEFVLYRELLRRHGYRAEICAPDALVAKDGGLWLGQDRIDFVYNRLTDFSLQQPGHRPLRDAYLAGEVALSPHPRAHALYADKRNLGVLGNTNQLREWGVADSNIATLAAAVPTTTTVTPEDRDAMWTNRRRLFFKPAGGYGSKASYRGDKLTRRVWDEIAGADYVAQEFVSPSERHQASGAEPLKVDLRCYAYRGRVIQYAARMYQGQTTNFRTPGGGFAPVLTSR